MAIWENISKKASETTAKAVQQAKVLSETARLSGLVSTEEKNLESEFAQLGKRYLELHADDYENEFSGIISAIQESKRKIADYQTQIQDVKGVIRCEKCGAEIAKGSIFCSCCGAPVPSVAANADASCKCPKCGAEVDAGARFCTACGHTLNQELPKPDTKSVCPACGATVEENSAFCTSCGAKIGQEE